LREGFVDGAVLVARDLRKKYGEKEAVRGVSFTVYRGECFGILGPNGAGKTTIVKMIFGLSPITSGELRVFGMDVRGNTRKIKKRLGVVGQEDNLDADLTVKENLEVFARFYGLRLKEVRPYLEHLLEMMGLADRANSRVNELSGGMKRRLAIARSLINNPSLLILDEPSTGLDPHARQLLWQMLRKIKDKGITMLLSTHYLEEAFFLCDRLIILDEGMILEEGRPADLVKKHAGDEVLEVGIKENVELWRQRIASKSFGQGLKGSFTLGDTVYFYLEKDGKTLSQRIEALGVPLNYQLLRPSNLEDVFLKLTGKRLEVRQPW